MTFPPPLYPSVQVLLLCSFVSTDAVAMWSYEGWADGRIAGIFASCVLIGCAMNFTTLHCTYLNSAVTTSFVGVVKSVATITVGMLAFSDVAPTGLFVGGVAVNTVGSVTYCAVKYMEMKKKSSYHDLEEGEGPAEGGAAPAGDLAPPSEPQEVGGGGESEEGGGPVRSQVMTDEEVVDMQREHLQGHGAPSGQAVSDSYLGVWRSIRHLHFLKKEPLVHNMEQQSP